MKKILILLFTLLASFSFVNANNSGCEYKESDGWDILSQLDKCADESSAVNPWKSNEFKIETKFKDKVGQITKNLMYIFWVIAIGGIALGWLMMTLSGWVDEKIKKWKDLIKWSIFGFLIIVSAWGIITIIVNIAYTLWK